MQIPIYLGAGILFQIPNLEFGINLGTGVGVLLEEIPDLQFVLNVGACLKFWRKLQICKFRQILATSGVGEVLKQIADLEFVSNVGVAELLQQIADLQFVVNLDRSPWPSCYGARSVSTVYLPVNLPEGKP